MESDGNHGLEGWLFSSAIGRMREARRQPTRWIAGRERVLAPLVDQRLDQDPPFLGGGRRLWLGSKGGFATLVGTAVTSSKAKLARDEKQEESEPVDGDVRPIGPEPPSRRLPKFFCVKATSFFDRV